MIEFEKRQIWFAVVSLAFALVLFLCSGYRDLAWLGLGLTVVGVLDFLFIRNTLDGWLASEVYGDPGEELWRFRSFVLMVGGPFLILYSILFA